MFSVRIRRSLSSLLITSILSSSLSPAFATLINHDDDNPEPQNLQTITPTAGSIFTLESINPFWDSLYSLLSPATRDTLGQVSKLTHEAQKRFDKNQMLRITLEGIYQSPNLTKRFGRIVVEEKVKKVSLIDPDLIYTIGDAKCKIGTFPEEKFDFSKVHYLDATLTNFGILRDLLTNAPKSATLHVSLHDTIDGNALTKIKDLFPFDDMKSESGGAAVKKQNSPLLRKLNSLRIITSDAATAISFLEWWSSHLRIGDQGVFDARPHLQIFINQITRDFKFSGQVSSRLDWDIKFAGAPDPRKVAAEISRSEQEQLGNFETDFKDFSTFLSTYHTQENDADVLGSILRKESLLKVLSHTDILEGVSIDSTRPEEISDLPYLWYPNSKHNLPFVKQFYEGQSIFEKRKEIIHRFGFVQPTTLVNCIALVSSEFSEFENAFRANLLYSLTLFPTFNREAAVQAVKKNAALGEKVIIPVLSYLIHFKAVDYNSILELLSGLFPKTASSDENSAAVATSTVVQEESPLEKLFGHLRMNNRVIQEIPGPQRFGALKYAVAFLEESADLAAINDAQVAAVLRAFGSLPNDAARDQLCDFLRINLPTLKDIDIYQYIEVASAIPGDQRAELIPILYPLITKWLENDKISRESVADMARIISDQQPKTRAVFCDNLEKLFFIQSFSSLDRKQLLKPALKKLKSNDLGDLLEKTLKAFEDGEPPFRGNTITVYFMLALSHYDQQERDAVFALVLDYASPTGFHRYRVLQSLKALPLTEVREMLNLLRGLSNEVIQFETNYCETRQAKAIDLLREIPAQHRSDVVTKAREGNPSELEFLINLYNAKNSYNNVQR